MSTDEKTIEALRSAMAAHCAGHHLDPRIAGSLSGRTASGPRRNRRRIAEVVSLAACLAAVLVIVSLVAGTGSGRHTTAPAADLSCGGAVVTSTLPPWARAGFSPGAFVNPHVSGTQNRIIGVLFTDPLRAPAAAGRSNKVLWVARKHGSGPLRISARLTGTSLTATSTVAGGPGPSTLDLPQAGCWQLTLRWSGQRDRLAVPIST